jgi:hypothetical protein
MLTNDGRFTCEIKSRIAMAKAAFNKKRDHFTSKMDLELRKKLAKCYIWSIALYGAETGTLWAVDQKQLESFEMWCWRRMENISWIYHVRNEEVLLKANSHTPCHSHNMPCCLGFRMCLSHFIYRVPMFDSHMACHAHVMP